MNPLDDVVVRRYCADDLPVIQRITIESFPGVALDNLIEARFGVGNEQDWKARKASQVAEDAALNPDGLFVAEINGKIVGYITTLLNAATHMGRIPNLAVSESARGMGLGRMLIEHALAYLRDRGMKIAQIETMSTNPIGQHLYPDCGFKEVARQVHYAMRL